MPPQRSRRLPSGSSFYDRRGAILETARSRNPAFDPARADTADADTSDSDSGDEGYTLIAYGELSSDAQFTLPPSATQTIKYRYRAFRPKAKLARLGSKSARSRALAGLKTSSSAYRAGTNDALAQLLSGMGRASPKRDFQALMGKYRESAEGWRDTGADTSSYLRASSSSSCKTPMPLRRTGSGAQSRIFSSK